MAQLPNSVTLVDLLRWVIANPNKPFDPNMVINSTHTSDWQWQAVIDQMERLRVQGYQTKVKQDPTGSTYWVITQKGENYLRAMERAEQAVETTTAAEQVQGQPTSDVVTPPVITKAFGAASIALNGTATLTFTISNNNKETRLTEIGFIDFLPAGLVISRPNGLVGSWADGQLIAREGSDVVSLEGAALPGGGRCSFELNVTGITAGIKNNTTRNIMSKESGKGNTASASISVVTATSESGMDKLTEKSSESQVTAAATAPPNSAVSPGAAPSRLPDVWMLSDRPLESDFEKQDRFDFKDYANALATIIDHERTETPFTMAINAPWGAGKTTLANMIAEQLVQRPKDRGHAPHIICRFNAWMHDDASNLGTALISEIGRQAELYRPVSKRILQPLPAALLEPTTRKKRWILIGIPLLVLLIVSAFWVASHLQRVEEHKKYEASKSATYQETTTSTTDPSGKKISSSESKTESKSAPVSPPPHEPFALNIWDRLLDSFQSRLVVLGAFIGGLATLLGLLAKMLGSLASTPLGAFVQSPDKAAEAGAIGPAEKQMRELIAQATWQGNRFIVFVDDIERCKPPRSVDILDAVNQLLDHKNVVVVFLGDMSAVAAAVQLKYKDIAEIFVPSAGIAQTGPDRGKEAFGRLYLQKIIQFQFDLPIPPLNKVQAYLQQLAQTPAMEGNRHGTS